MNNEEGGGLKGAIIVAVLYLGLAVILPCSFRSCGGEFPDETFCGCMADREMNNVVWLPLCLTEHSSLAVVRVGGVIVYFVWFFPAAVIALPAVTGFLLGDIFTQAARGTA